MKCPVCKQDNDKVVDTRTSDDGYVIRRRRLCVCGKRFTTYERVEPTHVRVRKRDGHCVPFDRDKLRQGLEKACWKRQIDDDQMTLIMTQVERDIDSTFESEVSSSYIGERVMHYLGELDQVALIRFASVYQHFENAGDFSEKVNEIINSSDDDDILPPAYAAELQALRFSNKKKKVS
jgi:transcriptional repressor NrdR